VASLAILDSSLSITFVAIEGSLSVCGAMRCSRRLTYVAPIYWTCCYVVGIFSPTVRVLKNVTNMNFSTVILFDLNGSLR
jgi:hypothetical protein